MINTLGKLRETGLLEKLPRPCAQHLVILPLPMIKKTEFFCLKIGNKKRASFHKNYN